MSKLGVAKNPQALGVAATQHALISSETMMLRSAVVLLCLLAACYAQVPPEAPVISGTFYATYGARESYIDQSGRHEVFGKGWRAYQLIPDGGRGVRNTTFNTGSEYKLELYDDQTVFDVHPSAEGPRCDTYKIGGEMNSYWNWLQYSRYGGTSIYKRLQNNIVLEWWTLKIGTEGYKLGVQPSVRDEPVVYERSSDVDNWVLTEVYDTFDVTIPDRTDFFIPLVCQRKLQQQKVSSPSGRRPMDRVHTHNTFMHREPARHIGRLAGHRRPAASRPLRHRPVSNLRQVSPNWRSISLHRRNLRRVNIMARRHMLRN